LALGNSFELFVPLNLGCVAAVKRGRWERGRGREREM